MAMRYRLLLKDGLLLGFWLSAFIATHLPRLPVSVRQVNDKTLHGISFAILGCLFSWVLHGRVPGAVRHCATVLLVLAIYGALDELLQIPVGRSCDIRDWFADMAGAVVGLAVFYCALWLSQRLSSRKPGSPRP